MEYALWNNQELIASDVGRNYSLEKQIRLVSKKQELQCPECKTVLRYCHGDKKVPYFAHRGAEKCPYNDFDHQTSEPVKAVINAVADILRKAGHNVDRAKIAVPHHVSHLLIHDTNLLAVEFITTRIGAEKTDRLLSLYQDAGIRSQFIVVSDRLDVSSEDQVSHAKRFVLNENAKGYLLVINTSASSVKQYFWDREDYDYHGVHFWYIKDSIYPESAEVSKLVIDNGYLTIDGFENRCKAWLNDRELRFQQWKEQTEKQTHRGNTPSIVITNTSQKTKSSKPDNRDTPAPDESIVPKDHNKPLAVDMAPRSNICGIEYGAYQKMLVNIRQRLVNENVWENTGTTHPAKAEEYIKERALDLIAEETMDCSEAQCPGLRTRLLTDLKPHLEDFLGRFMTGTRKNAIVCPRCGAKMIRRTGVNGPFMACSAFPNCRYTESIKG